MKKQESPSQDRLEKVAAKPRFEPPALQRLGTLRELTQVFPGMGMDGGGMFGSFP